MPYPSAHSHQQTQPETELEPERNRIRHFVGNAHTDRQTEHALAGLAHPPYNAMTTTLKQPCTLLNDVQAFRLNQYNGWASPGDLVYAEPSQGAENRVQDLRIRASYLDTSSGPCILNQDQAWKGDYSIRCASIDSGGSGNGRAEVTLHDPQAGKSFIRHQRDYWYSFVYHDANVARQGAWHLIAQLWNARPEKPGYGNTLSPALALERQTDTTMRVAIRSNQPGGATNETYLENLPWYQNQWQRFVVHFRLSTFDEGGNGHVSVWGAPQQEGLIPLTQWYGQIGYDYADPADANRSQQRFGLYYQGFGAQLTCFVDQLRLSDDAAADHHRMDPLAWFDINNVTLAA